MELYAILRRNGWRSGAELEEAAARSTKVADEQMPDDVRFQTTETDEDSTLGRLQPG